uniref:Rab-GAP TBC domain-containing protein n=1 Tax=Ditylenchus dipsaci TaxID=166011 RepID=A0A915D453_9BILA
LLFLTLPLRSNPEQFRSAGLLHNNEYAPASNSHRRKAVKEKREEYWLYVDHFFDCRFKEEHQETFRQIRIDIPRMCPLSPVLIFERLLFVWAVRHPISGYVQGINDLATPFFFVFLSEHLRLPEFVQDGIELDTFEVCELSDRQLKEVEADTFWCLSMLLECIQDYYTFSQPGIHLKVKQLKELIKLSDEKLYLHLESLGVEFLQFSLWDTYMCEKEGFSQFHVFVCGAISGIGLSSFSRKMNLRLGSRKRACIPCAKVHNSPTLSLPFDCLSLSLWEFPAIGWGWESDKKEREKQETSGWEKSYYYYPKAESVLIEMKETGNAILSSTEMDLKNVNIIVMKSFLFLTLPFVAILSNFGQLVYYTTMGAILMHLLHLKRAITDVLDSPSSEDAGFLRANQTAKNNCVDIELLRKHCWHGISTKSRPLAWRILCEYAPASNSHRRKAVKEKREEYWLYVDHFFDCRFKEEHQETFRQIRIDIPRMCPLSPVFGQPMVQEIFERLLFVWAVRHPISGYVQGINDLATPFFFVFLSEHLRLPEFVQDGIELDTFEVCELSDRQLKEVEADTFWCLSMLLECIQDYYTFSQPGIHLKVQELKELIKLSDEKLYLHLESLGTVDTYMCEKEGFSQFHVFVCGAYLRHWSEQLQSENEFEDVLLFLQNPPTADWDDIEIDALTADASSLMRNYRESIQQNIFDNCPCRNNGDG